MMRFARSSAVLALLFTTLVPGLLASPVETPSKDLVDRASTLALGSCVSPSQIDLSQSQNFGTCNWKEWALCTSIAAGACFLPCDAGG